MVFGLVVCSFVEVKKLLDYVDNCFVLKLEYDE